MLAYDYPLLGIFWSMLVLFLWIAWLMLLFRILGDILHSHDLGGFAKSMWIILVIIVPFLGVLVYLIARGSSMSQRSIDDAPLRQESFESDVWDTAGSASAGGADS